MLDIFIALLPHILGRIIFIKLIEMVGLWRGDKVLKSVTKIKINY